MRSEDRVIASIVIPVFNTPISALRRAVDSALCLGPFPYEIVVVNDGSSPNVVAELDRLESMHSDLRVIHQANAGVSVARNVGIESSLGTYVAFLDADDVIDPSFLKSSLDTIHRYDCPVAFGRISVRTGHHNIFWLDHRGQLGAVRVLSGLELEKARQTTCDITPSFTDSATTIAFPNVLGVLYSKSAIGQIRFPEGVSHAEDRIFNINVLGNVNRVAIVNQTWYTYDRTLMVGVTSRFSWRNVDDLSPTVKAFSDIGRSAVVNALDGYDKGLDGAAERAIINYIRLAALACGQRPFFFSTHRSMRRLLNEPGVLGAARSRSFSRTTDVLTARLVRYRLASALVWLGSFRGLYARIRDRLNARPRSR